MSVKWTAKNIPGLGISKKDTELLGRAKFDAFGTPRDIEYQTIRRRSPTNDRLLKKIIGG